MTDEPELSAEEIGALAERLRLTGEEHQTVYGEDRTRRALFLEAAAALPRLLSALAARERERDEAIRSLSPECRDMNASRLSFAGFLAGQRLIYAVDPKWDGSARRDFPELVDKLIAERDTLRAELAARERRIAEIRALVAKQAEDDGLWFDAQTAPEDYLQRALRKLHAAIENDARAALAAEGPK